MNTNDFLNPTSMLTPGIAGAMTTGLALPLVLSFELKYKWVALLLSLIISYLVVSDHDWKLSKIKGVVYWLLNGLIIFSVSVGAGININQPPNIATTETDPNIKEILMKFHTQQKENERLTTGSSFWISSAHADTTNQDAINHSTHKAPSDGHFGLQKQNKTHPKLTQKELKILERYLKNEKEAIEQQKRYHKRWSW
jgi:hypothetical protein